MARMSNGFLQRANASSSELGEIQMGTITSSIADIQPGREGVITLSGYGIHVGVDRGHLSLEDGIGAERRQARLPRVGHGLKRLVVIGSSPKQTRMCGQIMPVFAKRS